MSHHTSHHTTHHTSHHITHHMLHINMILLIPRVITSAVDLIFNNNFIPSHVWALWIKKQMSETIDFFRFLFMTKYQAYYGLDLSGFRESEARFWFYFSDRVGIKVWPIWNLSPVRVDVNRLTLSVLGVVSRYHQVRTEIISIDYIISLDGLTVATIKLYRNQNC